MDFATGARSDRLHGQGDSPVPTGTPPSTVRFWPDPPSSRVTFRRRPSSRRFQMMAFLNKGPRDRVKDERPDSMTGHEFQLRRRHRRLRRTSTGPGRPVHQGRLRFEAGRDDQERSNRVPVEHLGTTPTGSTAANGISTIEGGMHEEASRRPSPTWSTATRGQRASSGQGRRLQGGTSARASPPSSRSPARPQFEGQTKGKLGNVRCGRWSNGPPTRSWPTGSRSTHRGQQDREEGVGQAASGP